MLVNGRCPDKLDLRRVERVLVAVLELQREALSGVERAVRTREMHVPDALLGVLYLQRQNTFVIFLYVLRLPLEPHVKLRRC